MAPSKDATTNKVIYRHESLDSDGIVSPGEMMQNKQTMINKEMPSVSSINPVEQKEAGIQNVTYSPVPISYKGSEPSYVEKVLVTANSDEDFLIKILLRQTRCPEIGDKFSSRHGQKGMF